MPPRASRRAERASGRLPDCVEPASSTPIPERISDVRALRIVFACIAPVCPGFAADRDSAVPASKTQLVSIFVRRQNRLPLSVTL